MAKGSPRSGLARGLVGVLISAVALAGVLAWVDVAALREALRQASGRAFAHAAGWFVLAMLARAWAWRALLGPRVALADAFWALQLSFLANNLLPLRLGEALRVWAVHRAAGVPWSRGVASVALARLTDAALLAAMAVLLWPGLRMQASLRWTLVGSLLVLIVLLAGLAALARWGEAWLARWPRVMAEARAAAALLTPRALATFVLGKGLTWALLTAYYRALLVAFVPTVSWREAAWAMSVSTLGIALPSAPGYVGVYEAAAVAALALLGVPPETGLAFALAQHGLYLLLTVGLGLLALARFGWSWAFWRAAWRAQSPADATPSPGREPS